MEKVDGVTQKQPTFINIFNEPFARWKDGSGRDVVGWKDSIANGVLGDDVLIETYVMFYKEAESQGLEVGKDVYFFFNEYGINTDNPKKDLALRELRRARVEIAKRLGIEPDEVNLNLGLQQRYDETNPYDMPNDQRGRVRPPTMNELEATTREFLQIVNQIIFTEVGDFPATPEQRRLRFKTIVEVAKKLDGVIGVIFEAPLRFTDREPDITYRVADLFQPNYQKSVEYYWLVKDTLGVMY